MSAHIDDDEDYDYNEPGVQDDQEGETSILFSW